MKERDTMMIERERKRERERERETSEKKTE